MVSYGGQGKCDLQQPGVLTQLSEEHACPHDTNVNPSHGTTRQTWQLSVSMSVSAVVVAVEVDSGVTVVRRRKKKKEETIG